VSNSQEYWESRYASGGNSGSGSEGLNAAWKAMVLNDFVSRCEIKHVLEYGCGDGRQLALADYPRYTGLDVSATAITLCENRFQNDGSKTFSRLPLPWPVAADLVISLDVIYHLTEEDVFQQHMADVFGSSLKWVILYTTDSDLIEKDFVPADHVRHWPVPTYVEATFPDWEHLDVIMNPAPHMGGSDFYIYQRG
jgi:SAM-dependent methyltransferase